MREILKACDAKAFEMNTYFLFSLIGLLSVQGGSSFFPSSSKFDAPSKLLKSVLSGPLRDQSVLIIDDTKKEYRLDFAVILESSPSIMLAKTTEMNVSSYEHQSIKGIDIAVIWLVSFSAPILPILFPDQESWRYRYLLIISLGNTIDRETIFEYDLVKTTEFVTQIIVDENNSDDFIMKSTHPLENNAIIHMKSFNTENYPTFESMFPNRFPSLGGKNLRVASYCDDYPYLYSEPTDPDVCLGASIDMLEILSSSMNFTFDIQMEPTDKEWGEYVDGNWTGMLADITYHNQHLIINFFTLSYERWVAFDSIYPYRSEGFGFLSLLPQPLPKWQNLLLPFTWEMWVSIGVCLILLAISLAAIMRFISFLYKEKRISNSILSVSVKEKTYGDLLWRM